MSGVNNMVINPRNMNLLSALEFGKMGEFCKPRRLETRRSYGETRSVILETRSSNLESSVCKLEILDLKCELICPD